MSTLSLTRAVSGNTMSSATENANQSAIETIINGGLDDSNISASAEIDESKLKATVNPNIYLATLFNNAGFVMSGLTVSDGGGLIAMVSSGYCYVPDSSELKRVYKASSSNVTCVDSSTNYVYIDSAGTLSVSASATVSDKTLLAKVIASSGSISSITDCARRQPVLGQEHQIDGLELEYSDATHVKVNAGVCWIAGVKYLLCAQDNFDINSDSNWIGGSRNLVTGSQWLYLYITSSHTLLDIKVSDTAPAYSDAYGNAWGNCVDRYHYASNTPYRCIGAVYATDDGSDITAIRKFYQSGNYVQYDELQAVTVDGDGNIPSAITKIGYFQVKNNGSNTAEIKGTDFTDSLIPTAISGSSNDICVMCQSGTGNNFDITLGSGASIDTIGYFMNIRE